MSDKTKQNLKELIKDLLIACVIAFLISLFIRPTLVKETSMEPTVMPSDYLLISKQAYSIGDLRAGDIVVFKSDLKTDDGKHNKLLIKRAIALPGDIITITNGNVYINGSKVKETYTYSGVTSGEIYNLKIPKGKVFVMGDHREVSIDSRRLGLIDQDKIMGRAFVRLYPFNKIGVI